MVLQLLIALMAIAAGSLLIPRGRRRRIWSVMILTCLGVILYFFAENLQNSSGSGLIYNWLPYETLKADFNVSSSRLMQQVFFSLAGLLVGLVYLNTIFAAEQHSLHFNTLLLLNFIALILFVSSHDFLQLMFAESLFSIIGFYMPDLAEAKKKIFIFNFLAEMAVFMALAVVYGKTETINLSSLQGYPCMGWHKDLVAVLLMFAIGSKCGLFLLNGQYFNLKNLQINRITGIMMLSVPMSGVFLAQKLKPLLTASDIGREIFPAWCFVSAVIALGCALVNNQLKSKLISLALAVYAFVLFLMYTQGLMIYEILPKMLLIIFLAAGLIIIALNASSEEDNVACLGGFWKYTKFNLFLSLAVISAVSAQFSTLEQSQPILYFALAFISVLGIISRMIYLSRNEVNEKVAAFAKNAGFLYALPILIFSILSIWLEGSWKIKIFHILNGTFFAVFLLFPTVYLVKLGCFRLWQTDMLSQLYEIIIIRPLTLFGRILWLAFDFVVIERSIIGSASSVTSVIVSWLHKMQETERINYILGILAGIAVLLAYWGYYIYG